MYYILIHRGVISSKFLVYPFCSLFFVCVGRGGAKNLRCTGTPGKPGNYTPADTKTRQMEH